MKSVVYRRITAPFVFAAMLGTVSSLASANGIEASILPISEQAQTVPEKVDDQVSTNWRTGTYGAPVQPVPAMADSTEIRPFGAHLFSGGFRGVRSDGLNPTYKLVPGDQITLRVWGAVEFERVHLGIGSTDNQLGIPS
jgi:hypothetical protein